jgi:hypothetical protein
MRYIYVASILAVVAASSPLARATLNSTSTVSPSQENSTFVWLASQGSGSFVPGEENPMTSEAPTESLELGVKKNINVSGNSTTPEVALSYGDEGTTSLTFHFKSINLPKDASLTIKSEKDSVVLTGIAANFYAENVRGNSVTITYSGPPTSDLLYTIDGVTCGKIMPFGESVCGRDDSVAKICSSTSDPTKGRKSLAVARLVIGGTNLCTGWLFGSGGHLMTNHHCIPQAATASNLQVEFGADCIRCDDPYNNVQLACKGIVVAMNAQFIMSSQEHDFALVKLNVRPGVDLSRYGYLQARLSGPRLNEPIYVPHHPLGKPKRISVVVDGGAQGTISNFKENACTMDSVGYKLDTESGSSGAPVLSATDHAVVALHSCGGCDENNNGVNAGIKIDKIIKVLQDANALPPDAISNGPFEGSTTVATIKFRTKDNRVISEYFGSLVANSEVNNNNERFGRTANGEYTMFKSWSRADQCLDAFWGLNKFNLHTWPCSQANKNQQWIVDSADHRIKHAHHPNICLGVDGMKVRVWECHSHGINQNQWIDVVNV